MLYVVLVLQLHVCHCVIELANIKVASAKMRLCALSETETVNSIFQSAVASGYFEHDYDI